MRKKKIIALITFFVLIEQVIKIIIKNWFFDQRMNLLGELIGFTPKINTRYSWAGNFVGLFSSRAWSIFIVILAMVLVWNYYCYSQTKPWKQNKITNLSFIMLMSGCICSLIDRVIWNGSLDYVRFWHWFIFDLKDCYLTVAELGILYLLFRYHKELNDREYLNWNRTMWKKWMQKEKKE